jgi:hypothetical protein
MTNYRVYFEPMDIEAESPEEVQKILNFWRSQPEIVRIIIAENNVWDHRDEGKEDTKS